MVSTADLNISSQQLTLTDDFNSRSQQIMSPVECTQYQDIATTEVKRWSQQHTKLDGRDSYTKATPSETTPSLAIPARIVVNGKLELAQPPEQARGI